jgi:hypothetical protein
MMNNTSNNGGAPSVATPNAAQNVDIQQVAEGMLSALPAAQSLKALMQNPVGFVQQIVAQTTESALADLKDQAELRGALNMFRKAHPEFSRFESFILQEVVSLIETDPDGVIDPWDKLLEKAMKNFQRKFQETVNQEAIKRDSLSEPPFMEGSANRVIPEPQPAFSRDQIARMSLDEFLKNEAFINEALKNNRIR